MKKNKILEKLKPLSFIKSIFNYVKYDNFKLKLFTYSKFFQKKLNIQLIDYQEKYINRFGINLNDYLAFKSNYKENELKKKLEDKLIKKNIDINYNDIQNLSIKHFEKQFQEYKDKNYKNKIMIDIYSPFFESLSKNEIFENFTIKINIKDIEQFDLKNDYISIFYKLNKSKSNYSSLNFIFKNSEDIKYLNDFNINFGQIKYLTLFQVDSNIQNYNNFFEILFSLNNISNNLIFLILDIFSNTFKNDVEIEAKSLENLNNFKSLKYLRLSGFKFKTTFNIDLINLEHLYINDCSNIIFSDKINLNLKYLFLSYNTNVKPKNFLKLPEIETCILKSKYNSKENFRLMIDFSSLKKLKVLKANGSDFLLLENNNILNNIQLNLEENISKENEIKIIEKILSMKNLKNVFLYLNKIDIDDILEIQGENSSIEKLAIDFKNKNKDLCFNKIQNKFPNINDLSILISLFSDLNVVTLEINQNPNCKVNQLFLILKFITL